MTPEGHGILPGLLPYAKVLIAVVGLLLLFLVDGVVDRGEEHLIATGRVAFNPLRTNRAEFYAFFLFSLTGVMLCASADDLIWLFLALELTSLPTYIMVTISQTGKGEFEVAGGGRSSTSSWAPRARRHSCTDSPCSYGGTGTTSLVAMKQVFLQGPGINSIAMAGLLMALIGVGFKIAAVPMHLYTPDVYEGAAAPVSAFLAFTPKRLGSSRSCC
jgi:NADH-quinone oxidoreductase subunit N